ncbi:aquaporin-9-like [Ornithodoros turicata]|uniref:aquaporin-9-like n=1 Tax=Ornithodoros turicata TaxID=34597 RepID=UPI00313A2642
MNCGKIARAFRTVSDFEIKNPLARQCIAEFFGTLLLTLIGDCVLAVIILSGAGTVGLAAAPLGWGLAVFVGVLVTGSASGGHLNPAVTLGLTSVGKFSVVKALAYIMAQFFGGFVAAALVYAVYYEAIVEFDAGKRTMYGVHATASIFSCFPAPGIKPETCILDQLVSTAILLIAICAATDRNNGLAKGEQITYIALSVTATMYAFGFNCGNPLNPARDFAPRVLMAVAGWGNDVFMYNGRCWFWVPIVAPILGGVVGCWIYKLLIQNHFPWMAAVQRSRSPSEETRCLVSEQAES